jgi:hypothetical protein
MQNFYLIISFNDYQLHNNIIPKLAKIIIRNTSPFSKFTQNKTPVRRLKDEINYLLKTTQRADNHLN